jgi:hypothetical protein
MGDQNNLKINREWTRIDANKKNNPQITENLRHHSLFVFIRVHSRLNISLWCGALSGFASICG